jgi:broad specificity phosphatase PhoE
MKTVYLVRHGESEGNVGPRYQGETTPLTKEGEQQAQFMADRASKLTVEALIASPMVRAQQTAALISESTGLPIETSALFVERRRPSVQVGNLKESPEVEEAEAAIIKSSGISGYRYSDEENFDDLKIRTGQALTFLEEHTSSSILVVSHGVFLRNLAARVIFGEDLSGKECTAILEVFVASNTGLTVLTYDPERSTPWNIISWNDHAHLG